jgi:N-acetylmuramoyl-L-alanine amidase CwlA
MKRRLTKKAWRRRRKVKRILFLIVSVIILIVLGRELWKRYGSNNIGKDTITPTLSNGEMIKEEYLTPNPYSRPQTRLHRINGVVVHYTANPGSSAENNRSYFEGLATTRETSASSHYIIGLEGEIIQCIPLTEISYASNSRNDDTISIECCHPDKTGKFNDATYDSLVSLTAALCREFDLKKKDIIRHYDVTGKLCPLYYVEHEAAWDKFKDDVMKEKEKITDNSAVGTN